MDEVALAALPALLLAEASFEVDELTAEHYGSMMDARFDGFLEELDLAGIPVEQTVTRVTALPDRPRGARVALGVVVAAGTPAADGFEIVELPAEPLAATLLHRGSLATITESWMRLLLWRGGRADLELHGTESREFHLHAPLDDPAQESWITQLQLPVRPVAAGAHEGSPHQ